MTKLSTLEYTLVYLVIFIVFIFGVNSSGRFRNHKRYRQEHHLRDKDRDGNCGDKILKESIGVFKGGPDTYLLTFAEVRPKNKLSVISQDSFNDNFYPPVWQNSSKVRKKRRGDKEEEVTVSLETSSPMAGEQSEVLFSSGEVEEVVSSVLKATEGMRKGLGVCRKFVPRNFFNPPVDNLTSVVIKSLVGCVEEKLTEDLTCHDCITLHGDLQAFLNWLLNGHPGMACCPSLRKPLLPESQKHLFLFRQEGFGGARCGQNSGMIPTVCEQKPPAVTTPSQVLQTHPRKKYEHAHGFVRVIK